MIASNSRVLVWRNLRCLSRGFPFSNCGRCRPSRLLPLTSTIHLKPKAARGFHTQPFLCTSANDTLTSAKHDPSLLPIACPGCGALTQWVDKEQAGYYTRTRNAVRSYIQETSRDRDATRTENELCAESTDISAKVKSADTASGEELKLASGKEELELAAPILPLCDRCHSLVNHREAYPIPYPPLSYIRDIMEESPWHINHVYHILDAADFPLSLVPDIYRDLSLQTQRSLNRRAKTVTFRHGKRQTDVHFIITRADLLGGMKEHIDSLMTYMTQVLRDALGPSSGKVRLGNVHMVSAQRGWWTKEVKKKIWEEGGGVWMVGKANVGKSNLIQAIFPKSPDAARKLRVEENSSHLTPEFGPLDIEESGLLPPVQKQYDFPVLPIVSSLPGTTASPIRLPFGQKKGELIDLPGLFRGGIDEYVQDGFKFDVIMTKRPKPERLTVKSRQSLLLEDLVRITPVNFQSVMLASPFVPLTPHVTSTEKATEVLLGQRKPPHPPIAKKGTNKCIASAGVFELKYDVTEKYGKSVKQSKYQDGDNLTALYKIMSVDILIEGCGWVELITQIRTKDFVEGEFPKVEVFSPNGKCVGSRRPISAYTFLHEKRKQDAKKAGRRRRFG
ncbi:hypothetical protein CIRG_01832 [Coccidioides immitis RMSCC 2394]|uniref:G domain-containing protein n=1 Tax=Coccidioides immitis RMSCC 2394 TaxID=404692 RepID=A0A0J6Y4X0_COCIT|nr:hypothetical protein CIRG_01832 [Coccidioides immitis RMSCC 2394]